MNWRKKSQTNGSNTNNNNWTIGYNTNYGSKTSTGPPPHTSWAGISKSVKMGPSFGPGEYASGLISGTSEDTLRNNYRASTAGSSTASSTETIRAAKRATTAPATSREKSPADPSKKSPVLVSQSSEINKTNVSPVRRYQMQSLQVAKKDTETPLLSTIMMKTKPVRTSKKSVEQQVTSSVAKVKTNVISRTSHRAHVQLPQDTQNFTARLSKKGSGKSSRIERKQQDDDSNQMMAEKSADQREKDVGGREHEGRDVSGVEVASSPSYVTGTPLGKQPVYPKGANQLLVASATQVGNTFNNFQLIVAYFAKVV